MRHCMIAALLTAMSVLSGCASNIRTIALNPIETGCASRRAHQWLDIVHPANAAECEVLEPAILMDLICGCHSPPGIVRVGFYNDTRTNNVLFWGCKASGSSNGEAAVKFDLTEVSESIGLARGGGRMERAELVLLKVNRIEQHTSPVLVVEAADEAWEPGCIVWEELSARNISSPSDYSYFEDRTRPVSPGIVVPGINSVDPTLTLPPDFLPGEIFDQLNSHMLFTIDVTDTVREWLRGIQENHGFVLREKYLPFDKAKSIPDNARSVTCLRVALVVTIVMPERGPRGG